MPTVGSGAAKSSQTQMPTTSAIRKPSLRTFLVLARFSNLPTVWSNCLAAWLVVGGTSWARYALVGAGATLLYTGGMFLNDAVDVDFDRRYRPERPIASGQIDPRLVWGLGLALLVTGWAAFAYFGAWPAIIAGVLAGVILLYDVVHKHTPLAPLLMAACRFLLYLLAASAVAPSVNSAVVWRAAALGGYIVGLSYLARGESTGARFQRWTLVLLWAPTAIALLVAPVRGGSLFGALTVQCAWTLWCLAGRKPVWLNPVPQGVAGLLAGIALVDLVAAAGSGLPQIFLLLFVLALVTQRIAPAT